MPPETELTLGLPGGGGGRERSAAPTSPAMAVSGGFSCKKNLSLNNNTRWFVKTGGVDPDMLSSNGESTGGKSAHVDNELEAYEATSRLVGEVPAAKAQMIGWPPVGSFQKKVLAAAESCKYVKVAVDGAPYLRKVDLEMYSGYKELLKALQEMFASSSILGNCDEGKLVKAVKGIEYLPTYEDRDGDLMLVGDVPWKMFTESCKRIRVMKSSEVVGLGPRTTPDHGQTRI